jgi:diguanylate cyclase (GGDEF)-like protein
VWLTLVLLLVPILNLSWAAPDERKQHLMGFYITLAAFLLSCVVYLMVRQDRRQPWLPMATAIFDVSAVTLAQIVFAFVSDPQVVVNSKITFDVYFVALAGTCLRYDKRVALVAGVAAMIQFAATIGWIALAFPLDTVGGVTAYGRFQWSDQLSRLIMLTAATSLNVFIVSGIQTQKKLSNADPLTGVFNRRFFDDYLRNELARATRHNAALSVVMIDVDHFKQFNDRYGHAVGDQALCQVARSLESAIRQSDLIARYGGEEFVLILRESAAAHAMERVEYIRRTIAAEQLVTGDGRPKRITVSAGVASWPIDGQTPSDLLAEADRRLFLAKAAGRNCVIGPMQLNALGEVVVEESRAVG